MNKKTEITLDKEQLVGFLDAILKDDHGISEDAYNKLHDLLNQYHSDPAPNPQKVAPLYKVRRNSTELMRKLSLSVEAVDGRFFIPNV